LGTERIGLLEQQMRECYEPLRDRLHGLGERESLWEPVAGWNLRRRPDGGWTYDYAVPDPDPAPFTTIGWRVWHVAACKVMYHEYAFGPGTLTWDEYDPPGSGAELVEALEGGQSLLAQDLTGLAEDRELDVQRLTNWGEPWPTWRIFWTMIRHDAHHGAEIACLRDLYAGLTRDGADPAVAGIAALAALDSPSEGASR
jgi:hypothetical protein